MDISKEVLEHLKYNLKTEIKPSSIHGVGTFAIRDIEVGEQVFPEWKYESGIYLIENSKLPEIPSEVLDLLDKYYINGECGYKIIKLFKGLNFTHNSYCYCNSSHPNPENANISIDGVALKPIKKGEEILEYYFENIS